MKTKRNYKALDFLPPIVAFAAAVVAIVGESKWNVQGVGFDKITPTGWIVICISLTALMTSLLVTLRNHRQQALQQALRSQIAKTGREQLLRGVKHMIFVFQHSKLWDKERPEPKSPLDMLDNERRAALSLLNLNEASDYADGKGNVKWWEMFENTAIKGASQITTALQSYVTYLDAELIEAATRLLNCDFVLRLQHTHEIIDANTRGEAERPVRFFWVSPNEHMSSGYEEFWQLVDKVMQLCTGNYNSWQTP